MSVLVVTGSIRCTVNPLWNLFGMPVLILATMMAIYFMKSDTRSTKNKNLQQRTDLLSCPKCDTKLKDTNLKDHLKKRHFYSQSDAAEELESQTLP